MAENTVPEAKLTEFVQRIREAAGANLLSVILYGSAANGEYQPGFSNLNIFCVLRDGSFAALEPLSPVARWWAKDKQAAPLFMTAQELSRSTDVFTIELLDMQQHHRLLFGEDPLLSLNIPLDLHRVQVEYELREKLVLLRQQALLAAKDAQLEDLLIRSVPSFTTLFRHVLIALGFPPATSRREAVRKLAAEIKFDASAFEQVLDIREKRISIKTVDVRSLFARYLAAIEQATASVDRIMEAKPPVGS